MPPSNSERIRHGALHYPTAQLRREITSIIPSGTSILGRTPTERERIQLCSLIILLLLLLLLSRILMVLLRRKLESAKTTLVPRSITFNMRMRRPPLAALQLCSEALSDTLTGATRQERVHIGESVPSLRIIGI